MASIDLAEEGGEGYFASVSDLMVGILFVFLLMLTVFALNFRDAEDDQKVALELLEAARREARLAEQRADAARAEAEIEKRRAAEAILEAERQAEAARQQKLLNERLRHLLEQALAQLERDIEDRQAARSRLLASLERSLQERGVRVLVDQRSGILRLAGDLLFKKDVSTLEPEARRTVGVLAEVLSQVLPCYATVEGDDRCTTDKAAILEAVLVEGHTDRQSYRGVRAAQSTELNDRLSTERALTVFKELRLAQPALDVLRNGDQQPLLAFSGYGERRPLPDALGSTEDSFQKNRRIDLRFLLSARSSDELQRLREQIRRALEGEP